MNTKIIAAFGAVALCGAVAHAEITQGSNIVGYQNVVVTNGYSIFAPTFKGMDAKERMDLTTIGVLKSDGTEIPTDFQHMAEWCGGAIQINVMETNGFYAASYQYYRNSGKQGWYKGDEKVAVGKVFIEKGQGIMINNIYKISGVAQTVLFRVSGEVELIPVTDIPFGYSIYGNCTPVDVDLSDIKILKSNGEEIPIDFQHMAEWCGGAIQISILGQDGFYSGAYQYYRNSGKQGWYSGDAKILPNDRIIKAGEAFLVNNIYKVSNVPQTVKISIPSPISEAK